MPDYEEMMQKRKWLAGKARAYPNRSMNDAPVQPEFPRSQCDCDNPAHIIQSTHLETAAKAYYMCLDIRPSERCYFFQWIDGPDKYDRAFIQQKYMLNYAVPSENFTRWKAYLAERGEDKAKAAMVCKEPGWWWKTASQLAEDDRAKRVADMGRTTDAPAKRVVTSEIIEAQHRTTFGTGCVRRSAGDKGTPPMGPQN